MLAALPAGATSPPGPTVPRVARFYVGTQAEDPAIGISAAELDLFSGRLRLIGRAAGIARPTWLLSDPHRPRLYAVQATGFDGRSEAAVFAYAIDRSGSLSLVDRQGSGGGGATHLAMTPDGRTIFVANYAQGRIKALAIRVDGTLAADGPSAGDDGSGPHARQVGPHAHGLAVDPAGRTLAVADLGADRVFFYRALPFRLAMMPVAAPLVLPAGSGPRHLVYSRDGRFLFVLTELSAEVFAFRCIVDGRDCREVSRIALDPPGYSGPRSGAEIMVSRDGRRLYASDRGEHLIHVFAVDAGGRLTEIQRIDAGGLKPWTLAFAPGGRWLVVANQGSGTLTSFAVDPATGRLSPSGARLGIDRPVAIAFAAHR